jgi:hypothetical protein
MDACEKVPALVSESGLRVGTCDKATSDRPAFKSEMAAAVRRYLVFGMSDFEDRRRRTKAAALAKGGSH